MANPDPGAEAPPRPRLLLATFVLTGLATTLGFGCGGGDPSAGTSLATAPASLKFCNTLGGADAVEVQIAIGGTTLSAVPGQCAPAVSQPCLPIPSGVQTITMTAAGKTLYSSQFSIAAGAFYAAHATKDAIGVPTLVARTLDGPAACLAESAVGGGSGTTAPPGMTPSGLPGFGGTGPTTPPVTSPPGMTPPMTPPGMTPPMTPPGGRPGGAAVGKFCHGLTASKSPVELELVVGSLHWKATTGACSTPLGSACAALPAGPVTMQVLRNGMSVATGKGDILAGKEYLFLADLDDAGAVTVEALPLKTTAKCATVKPFEDAGGMSPPPAMPPPISPPPTTPPATPPSDSTARVRFCAVVDSASDDAVGEFAERRAELDLQDDEPDLLADAKGPLHGDPGRRVHGDGQVQRRLPAGEEPASPRRD